MLILVLVTGSTTGIAVLAKTMLCLATELDHPEQNALRLLLDKAEVREERSEYSQGESYGARV